MNASTVGSSSDEKERRLILQDIHFIFSPRGWRSHTATGCSAAENQTYDVFAESPSLPYISVGNKHRKPSFVVWVNIRPNLYKNIKDKLKLSFIMFQNNHVTKCTCTSKSVKLNVSSPLCHKIRSRFVKSWCHCWLWRTFWGAVECLCCDSHVWCRSAPCQICARKQFTLTPTDSWKQEDTRQP